MSTYKEALDERVSVSGYPDVYPYLVTRIVAAMYHVILLPKENRSQLLVLAARQAHYNDLRTALVLDADTALYLEGGAAQTSKYVPAGGTMLMKRLSPCFDIDECLEKDPTYANRLETLNDYAKAQKNNRYLFGDLTKGGRDATPECLAKLKGNEPGAPNVPRGLYRCAECKDYRGTCLDPSPQFKNKVMTVSCYCDNNNCCAQCLKPLYSRKLNANYFEPKDGQIWHVPAFSGLSHKCDDDAVLGMLVRIMKSNGELEGLSDEEQLSAIKLKAAIPEEWARAREEYEENEGAFRRHQRRR